MICCITNENQPTKIVVGSSLTDSTPVAKDEFAYDPNGQRYARKSTWQEGANTVTEQVSYIGTVEIISDDSNVNIQTITKTRISPHVKIVGSTTETFFEYAHRDHLGSIEVVTDENGNALDNLAFEPFGSRKKMDWTANISSAELTAALALDWDHPRKVWGFTADDPMDEITVTGKRLRPMRSSVFAGYFGSLMRQVSYGVYGEEEGGARFLDDDGGDACTNGQTTCRATVSGTFENTEVTFYAKRGTASTGVNGVILRSGGITSPVVNEFLDFVRKQGVERHVDFPYVHEQIASKWEDIPEGIWNYEPNDFWASIVDDRGAHLENQRLPGGYHVTVDDVGGPVFVHYDTIDPSLSFGDMLNHVWFEVARLGTNSNSVIPPTGSVNNYPDWFLK